MAYDQELAQCEKDYREISEAYNATCVVAERLRAEIERLQGAISVAVKACVLVNGTITISAEEFGKLYAACINDYAADDASALEQGNGQ